MSDTGTDRRFGVLAGLLPAALGLPSVLAGPGFHADDWFFLARARFDDGADVGGIRQSTRPLANALYRLEFGVIGAHPAAIRLLLLVLAGLVAWLLHRVLLLVVDRGAARLATLIWIVVPTHLSAERWASAGQASLALVFVLAGALLLLRGPPAHRASIAGVGLLCLGVLSYELVVGLAALAVLEAARRHPDAARLLLTSGGLGLGGVLVWRTTEPGVYGSAALGGPPDVVRAVTANLSLGIDPDLLAGRVVASAWVAAAVATIWLARDRPDVRPAARSVVAGIALVVAGLGPLVQVDPRFTGLGDRFNTVSSIGAALVVAGVLRGLVPERRVVLAVAVAAVPAAAARVSLDQHWARSADAAVAYVDRLDATLPASGAFDMATAVRVGEIDGITDGWHATAALRLRRDGSAPAGCFQGIPGSGPGCGATDPVAVG